MNYTGQIQDGQMHGQGTLEYPNGERYDGQWHFGKREGYGVYYYLDGGRYEGEWVDDKIHGQGKSFYANGNVYDGQVRVVDVQQVIDIDIPRHSSPTTPPHHSGRMAVLLAMVA